jgi:hypothetical protein
MSTMKGLVGDAGSGPDLTPAATGDPCGLNSGGELTVGVHDHCGGFPDSAQRIPSTEWLVARRLNQRRSGGGLNAGCGLDVSG